MIVIPTGKRVEEHIYASERRGEMIYRVVDPQTKCVADNGRGVAVKEGPLHEVFSIITFQMTSRVPVGASGLGEAELVQHQGRVLVRLQSQRTSSGCASFQGGCGTHPRCALTFLPCKEKVARP